MYSNYYTYHVAQSRYIAKRTWLLPTPTVLGKQRQLGITSIKCITDLRSYHVVWAVGTVRWSYKHRQ